MWVFSYAFMYSLRGQFVKDFIAAIVFLFVFGFSIGLMVHVRRTNFSKWKQHRGTLHFSQNFQVRENVASATYLYKCFVRFSVLAIIGWCCLVLWLVFRNVYKVPLLEKVCGFIFDIAVAMITSVIPITIAKHNLKLRLELRRIALKLCVIKNFFNVANVGHFVDLEGRTIRMEIQGTNAYFEQLKKAWS